MLLLTSCEHINYVRRLTVQDDAAGGRAVQRNNKNEWGNRIAGEHQIERKHDPRKPLMHLRSRSKQHQVLASPARVQTMFFRNGSKFTLEGAHRRLFRRVSRSTFRGSRLPWPSVYAKWDPFRDFLRTRLKEAAYTPRRRIQCRTARRDAVGAASYILLDRWMDAGKRAVSREIHLAGSTRPEPFRLQNRGSN